MKYEEYPIVIPDLKKITKEFNAIYNKMETARNAEEFSKYMRKMMKFSDHLQTQMTTIETRYSIDTTNEIYANAQNVLDEVSPMISALFDKYNKLIVNSKFRKELEKKFGQLMFKQTELSLKCFDEKIVEDLQKENKLSSEYTRILASAKIKFQGGVYNLSQMGKFFNDTDREIRKNAAKALYKFYDSHEEEIANIYDQLVHIRDEMAKKLGYKNYIPLGYARLGRLDYNDTDVATYRKQVEREVVPLYKKLKKRQAKRIKISHPKFYDTTLNFLSGNPKPVGNSEELVKIAQNMYNSISKETGEFFSFMVENHLLDLDAKPGKSGGGYMTYFPDYKSPFIFSNFNGTSGDVDVLTHEGGHAFQGYCTRNEKIPDYRSPTLEACEIHSMSMEFFAWPYMNDFFKEDADKYRFTHLADAMMFIPYGVCVDEFQHFVYENPNATHQERCQKWLELESKYTPDKNYKGFPYLERGNFWMKQSHIFQSPFYYIDYTLAQVAAFQFLVELQKDYQKAWKKYVKLCKLGGKYPYLTLLEKAHIRNPFVDGNIKKVIRPLKKLLDSFDDFSM